MRLNISGLGRRFPLIGVCIAGLFFWEPDLSAKGDVMIGGAFALTTSDGIKVTDRTYRGKWLLVYFGYTSCPDTCPTTLTDLAAVLKKLGAQANDIQPLFVTIDPRRDTPKILEGYMQSFDPRIVALTGAQKDIDIVVQAYGAYVVRHDDEGTQNYTFDHSGYIYLMDPNGSFVRGFDAQWSSDAITAAIKSAIASYRKQSPEHTADMKN